MCQYVGLLNVLSTSHFRLGDLRPRGLTPVFTRRCVRPIVVSLCLPRESVTGPVRGPCSILDLSRVYPSLLIYYLLPSPSFFVYSSFSFCSYFRTSVLTRLVFPSYHSTLKEDVKKCTLYERCSYNITQIHTSSPLLLHFPLKTVKC